MTLAELEKVMRTRPVSRLAELLPHLNAAMAEFSIDTPARQAAFLAQLALESGELRHFKEIWGPTAQQLTYEGRGALGNVNKGDGHRYMGRGAIQLTGRANYTRYARLLGVDIIRFPHRLEEDGLALRSAACFWFDKGLNALADVGDFKAITRRINGGLTHHDRRVAYWERAKLALGVRESGA